MIATIIMHSVCLQTAGSSGRQYGNGNFSRQHYWSDLSELCNVILLVGIICHNTRYVY